MVIQVALCSVCFIMRREHRKDQFLAGCFSIAAGNGDKRYIKLFAVMFCKSL